MLNHLLFSAITMVAIHSAMLVSAQEPADPQSPDLTREKLVKMVEIKQMISKERSDWDTEKKLLSDLIKLRKQEIEKENEIVGLAEQRVKVIDDKKIAFANEIKEREQWRNEFADTVNALEQSLVPNLGYLPPPVKKELKDAIDRLQSEEPKTIDQLQTRFRDVSAILNECTKFNSKIHTYTEIREVEGEKLEVEVLYLGLTQAWYVDRTGRRAGTGTPTETGWVWKSRPAIAAQVRKAIEVQSKRETPAFAKLPILNGQSQ